MRKLSLCTKFLHQEIKWNYSILRSIVSHIYLLPYFVSFQLWCCCFFRSFLAGFAYDLVFSNNKDVCEFKTIWYYNLILSTAFSYLRKWTLQNHRASATNFRDNIKPLSSSYKDKCPFFKCQHWVVTNPFARPTFVWLQEKLFTNVKWHN